ncbi:TPA: conserved phage C-terminal domain-containing protein [Salmonella enterica subsp. enterica serovar Weltevreden]|uniref:conserved phage C-terminal domain-containing protein n=1 Tax=Citrobacter freundii complex TaxID=1344959 RepID=UPI000D9AF877|nr:conserved phage C-terminal domain-containing protein [Citrobacter freundii]EBA4008612.1 GntR family transcriptional regulator [Salmonella enterica]MDU7722322.1 conserved phage C-terminal domain-containing protein [Citrobacter sp.]HEC6891072.1 conserved phage C-terminal domain-containing protein [Salmonella enterica subsp. enterica serovar Weltevreden]EBQ1016405.1 GntR family transcriptional regulator [Salmonella enterica]EIR1651762.1 conserved phage C-terminal domain-containing protein [Sal
MSTKLTGYVWDACASSGMKLSSVAIMARLADFSSDEGVSWPSIGTIARQIGAGESTVRTALAQLEKDGWLSRKQRRNGNRNASNVYQLNVVKLREAAFSHLSESDASKSDPSKSDASKSDPSKFEASKSSKKGGFDPSESGGDPSVKSKQDPQVTSKPSCPVAAQPDREVLITDQAKSVLSHLNQVTNSRYQVSTTSMQNIRARIGEGFTVEELSLVVDYCNAKWGDDLKMSDYLRPQTLFQPSKFPGYLKSANNWDKAGRPERVNGEWAREDGIFKPSFKNTDYSAIPPGFRG